MGDYDQGAYSLYARLIAQGSLPYRDFIFVSPPFYVLVLSTIYRIFGYNFYYGQYLSVFLSLASIVLIYFTGRKISRPGVGLVAAAFFAVSPEMIYAGRRVTQEALCIFLVVLAIYFIVDFIITSKRSRLIFCGLVLGLAVAAKYTFLPAALAVVGAAVFFFMGETFWDEIRKMVKPVFLLTYGALVALAMAVLFLVVWVGKVSLPVPFFSETGSFLVTLLTALVVFGLPLLLSLLVMERDLHYRQWWALFIRTFRRREIWYLAAGGLFGFFIVTIFFLVKAPHQFLTQTLSLQDSRGNIISFPSIQLAVQALFNATPTAKLAYLPAFLALPVAWLVLNKRTLSPVENFIVFGMIFTFFFCQFFMLIPRYYLSLYPFFLFSLSFLVPWDADFLKVDFKLLTPAVKSALICFIAVFLLFVSLSCVLLVNYGEYDEGIIIPSTDAHYVYQQTDNFLNSISAKKVFSVDPMVLALDPGLGFTSDFDTYSALCMVKESPSQFLQDQVAQGVDYAVIDNSWLNNIGPPAQALSQVIESQARLVGIVAPGSPDYVTIWALNAPKAAIYNGNFTQWAQEENNSVPLGWLPVFPSGAGVNAAVSHTNIGGQQCVELSISTNGATNSSASAPAVSLFQSAVFPGSGITFSVYPTGNTSLAQPTGIHFTSGDGHTLILGFSDAVKSEQITKSADGNTIVVLRNAALNQWSDQTINLADYWNQAGWALPQNINIQLVAAVGTTNPGGSTVYVSNIGIP
jgi:4-amino-4-deoxy-L-arabinose transferase-like glycosyltransferase